MAITDFESIEFGVCVNVERQKQLFRIPIDDSVREGLSDMYDSFYNQYERESPEFQASEKYSATESLHVRLNHENLTPLAELYNNDQIPISQMTGLASAVVYYFAIFRTGRRTKKVAVKRPSQFKGLLEKKLIYFIDDTLRRVPDDVFKLDNDFDFVIGRDTIEIIHPTGFIFIADIDQEVMRTAAASTRSLSTQINFIDFETVATFVETSKTAAKLIASIKMRPDLNRTSQTKLARACRDLQIPYTTVRGRIVPEAASTVRFLEVLDRREYLVDITSDDPEIYVASSRRKVGG